MMGPTAQNVNMCKYRAAAPLFHPCLGRSSSSPSRLLAIDLLEFRELQTGPAPGQSTGEYPRKSDPSAAAACVLPSNTIWVN
jgi:hypothetical protein